MLHVNVVRRTQTAAAFTVNHSVPRSCFLNPVHTWGKKKIAFTFFHKDESKNSDSTLCSYKVDMFPSEYTQTSGVCVPDSSPLSGLVLPLCWSISLHDDRCYISHMQVSFLYWLWQGQTWNVESLMSQLKKWKHNTCLSKALKWHHKA